MKRHLFLSGPAFCGKSSLIREHLGRRLQMAWGFCTALRTADDGGVLGCCLMPAAMAGGAAGFEEELFLDMRSFPPGHDSEVFRGTGVRLLEEAGWYPFAVLDEIGGIDLIIPQFRAALDGLLQSELPILGVVKSEEACEDLRQALGPGERFSAFSERLHRMLRTDPQTELFSVSEDAEREAGALVDAWIEEYASVFGY